MDGPSSRWTRAGGPALISALVAAGTVALGSGTYALFSDTKQATLQVGTGDVELQPLSANETNNRLSVAATGITPGGAIQRVVNVRNIADTAMSDVTLTTSAESGFSTLLDTDTTHGLQLVIERCPAPWTESSTTPNFSYACKDGTGADLTPTATLTSMPVIGADRDLAGLMLTRNVDNHLRVTLTLPSTADDDFQGLSTRIVFAFTGTQATS